MGEDRKIIKSVSITPGPNRRTKLLKSVCLTPERSQRKIQISETCSKSISHDQYVYASIEQSVSISSM